MTIAEVLNAKYEQPFVPTNETKTSMVLCQDLAQNKMRSSGN